MSADGSWIALSVDVGEGDAAWDTPLKNLAALLGVHSDDIRDDKGSGLVCVKTVETTYLSGQSC